MAGPRPKWQGIYSYRPIGLAATVWTLGPHVSRFRRVTVMHALWGLQFISLSMAITVVTSTSSWRNSSVRTSRQQLAIEDEPENEEELELLLVETNTSFMFTYLSLLNRHQITADGCRSSIEFKAADRNYTVKQLMLAWLDIISWNETVDKWRWSTSLSIITAAGSRFCTPRRQFTACSPAYSHCLSVCI